MPASIGKKQLSIFISRLIPKHIVDEYPKFVTFIEDYFIWLERDLGEYDVIANLIGYADIDNTPMLQQFVDEYRLTYLGDIPPTLSNDLSLLIKNIRSFYQAKGSEESYRFLFRALYNQSIEFYYPKVDILRVSDGKWITPVYLIPTDQTPSTLALWVNEQVTNGTATSFVIKTIFVDDPASPGNNVEAFYLEQVTGAFQDNDVISSLTDASLGNLTIRNVVNFAGFWRGNDGFIDDLKFIQDGNFYQELSYEIQSEVSESVYLELVKKILHPAGTKLFGKLVQLDVSSIPLPVIAATAIWVIAWLEQMSVAVTESVLSKILSEINAAIFDFTYAQIEADRETNRNIKALFPTIGEFDDIVISDFTTKASLPFEFFSDSIEETITGNHVLLENGVDILYEGFPGLRDFITETN